MGERPRATLVIRDARVLTLANGPRPRRGVALGDLAVIPRGDVAVEDGRIVYAGPAGDAPTATHQIDARRRVLLPGFVDCHTHACWAGDRLDEWEQRLRGVPYLDILKAGGGIMRTVRAVRAASLDDLAAGLRTRLDAMLALGTTTAEVKSGYGLSATDELKMLRAIGLAAADWPGTVQATALLGHAIDGDAATFIEGTVGETLAVVGAEYPGIAVDAFCEEGAWPLAATRTLLSRARERGHPVRLHGDQFNSLGAVELAVELGARSVDHLEAGGEKTRRALAASPTLGVLLPVTGFQLDGRYANGRALVDAGAAVALATNWNPGSAPSGSMPFAIALAVRHCGLTPSEAIAAATVNAAAVLGYHDRGTIAPGQRADLLLLHATDERALAYELGGSAVATVIANGRIVAGEGPSS